MGLLSQIAEEHEKDIAKLKAKINNLQARNRNQKKAYGDFS